MGARPSTFKRGGGFLNQVDAVIKGYAFLVSDSVKVKNGARKGEDFTPLSLAVSFMVDGAEEAVDKRLLIGDADSFGPVSEDGLTLETPEGQNIPASSEAGIFIISLCDAGFDDQKFSDDPDSVNFEPMINERIRLVQETNVEKTKRQGQQVGKDGKKYDRKDLKVSDVYGQAAVVTKPAATKAKPAAAKAAVKPVAAADDATDLAIETLLAVVKAAGGGLLKKSLPVKIAQHMGAKHPQREAVRKLLINSDDLLNLQAGWTYDAADKTQTIALSE